jgi:hypothetical protein
MSDTDLALCMDKSKVNPAYARGEPCVQVEELLRVTVYEPAQLLASFGIGGDVDPRRLGILLGVPLSSRILKCPQPVSYRMHPLRNQASQLAFHARQELQVRIKILACLPDLRTALPVKPDETSGCLIYPCGLL